MLLWYDLKYTLKHRDICLFLSKSVLYILFERDDDFCILKNYTHYIYSEVSIMWNLISMTNALYI